MPTLIRKKLFAHSSEKPAQSPHRALPKVNFSIPRFEADSEHQFWQECQIEILSTLKTALLLGVACFLAFFALDSFNGDLTKSKIIGCSLITLTLSLFYISLHWLPQPETNISLIAKLSAVLSLAYLAGTLLVDVDPLFYAHIWIGLFPVYVFIYGQMFMGVAETIKLGLLAMIVLPVCGYLVSVEPATLFLSIMILLIVNIFGFYTRHQLEVYTRNLFRERQKAECTSSDKTQFLLQLSHNLRQPIQALSCYTSVLDTSFANKPGDPLQHVITKLGSAIDELNYAFNHILDISNLETGRQIPQLAAVDINTLLASLESQFSPLAVKQGLKLKVQFRTRPPYKVYSDVCILSQIIGNLIDNAIKYTTSGWIIVSVVKISNERLKLHVRDSGIGIAEDMRDEIFKAFFRCHRRQADLHAQGLGIGLAYAIKATECLPNHRLQVYSRLHQGSDFQLSLPAIDSVPQHSQLKDCFVFIVDTDRKALTAMAEQLTAWGCLVQQAGSKAEIQATLAENYRPPDLLITNFYLDNQETAHDIISAIQDDCGPVPVLILSAQAIADEDKAKWPGNIWLLRKPTGEAVLMEMMVKAMGIKTTQ